MKQPAISLIVPIYNGKDLLPACLTSIAAQTFRDFECIVVDDGSTDGTAEVLDEFCAADARFIPLHIENGGVSAARNQGLSQARGEYICFVDGDDTVRPGYLAHLYHPEFDFTLSGIATWDVPSGRQLTALCPPEGDLPAGAETSARLLSGLFLNNVYAKLFRRSILEENRIRFQESIAFAEDTVFVVEFLPHAKSIHGSGDLDYEYKKYGIGTTLSTSFSIKKFRDGIESSQRIEAVFKEAYPSLPVDELLAPRYFFMYEMHILSCALYGNSLSREEQVSFLREVFRDPRFRSLWKKRRLYSSQPKPVQWLVSLKSPRLLLLGARIMNRLRGRTGGAGA